MERVFIGILHSEPMIVGDRPISVKKGIHEQFKQSDSNIII